MTVDEYLSGESVTGSMYSSSQDPHASVVYRNLRDEKASVKELKGIVSSGELLELLEKQCRHAGCNQGLSSVNVHCNCGYALKLVWTCNANHRGVWYSSPTYAGGFAINHIVDSALLLAGMSHQQFLRFCQFINLVHTSTSTFQRNQRLYAAPAIH